MNLSGTLKSIQQGMTNTKIPFARTPKVNNRTASPALYVTMPWVIIIYSCMVFYADTFSHNWGNAVFAGFNAVVTFWALTAYIGTYLALTALESRWWGEGEVKMYIDGDDQYPTWCSTGAEDYFGGALNRMKVRPGKHDAIEGMEQLDKVIAIDQSPIGRTPRSNPATYTNLFNLIRDLFASTPDAKARGYGPGRFSFNTKGGRCEACGGDGMLKIEMHFLSDVYVPCEICRGKRYNRETLEVRYKGKNIADVLDMTVDEAWEFFSAVPAICDKLTTLRDVGLGYVKLGQPSTTLSGGEAQRVKLATELSRRATGRTVYILDEPTTGLHADDVRKLLEVLQRLTDGGNTVLVIEHNLDVIKCADYIIDLGPEGGVGGGTVVACGTPEEIAACPASYTGQYLKKYLK